MYDGMDWMMRPVLSGCCHYESLLNCALSLEDVARINDALDVRGENEMRLTPAPRK